MNKTQLMYFPKWISNNTFCTLVNRIRNNCIDIHNRFWFCQCKSSANFQKYCSLITLQSVCMCVRERARVRELGDYKSTTGIYVIINTCDTLTNRHNLNHNNRRGKCHTYHRNTHRSNTDDEYERYIPILHRINIFMLIDVLRLL